MHNYVLFNRALREAMACTISKGMLNQQRHMSHSKQVKEHEVGNTLLGRTFGWIKRFQSTDDCAVLVLLTCQWVGVNIKSSCKK
jgi:hypothetical protein